MPDKELSYGETLVGIGFNPDKNPRTASIKRKAADLIDEFNDMRVQMHTSPEEVRMLDAAITGAHTAQMLAVRAVHWETK